MRGFSLICAVLMSGCAQTRSIDNSESATDSATHHEDGDDQQYLDDEGSRSADANLTYDAEKREIETGVMDVTITDGGIDAWRRDAKLDLGLSVDRCGTVSIQSDIDPIETSGNLLILFDRSTSMGEPWNSSYRYKVAGEALIDAVSALQDRLTIGVIFFPSVPEIVSHSVYCDPANPMHWSAGPQGYCLDPNFVPDEETCVVNEITASDQLSFRPASQFITELPRKWSPVAGMIPLEAALHRADQAMSSTIRENTTAVVILIDGEPDCGISEDTVEDLTMRWLADDIKTYVISLPGSSAPSDILSYLAFTGGTEDVIEPDNLGTLPYVIGEIASEIADFRIESCIVTLERVEDIDPEEIDMLVIDYNGEMKVVPRNLGNGSGWSIGDDGVTVTLKGELCEEAKEGRFSGIDFVYYSPCFL